ncbi:hypothetical protein EVAR_82229_1 [Eumeta japonica]|uniref:ATP-dependent DNA helicase n=1 Tax=Eumeta variegata TaxID=151549 RepID=A0A4C1VZW6_EUMVA|nr:hypothetical protein EVAR_82229_1 [Eumeta japonica]
MYSVEWQKRGLPHAHILIWLLNKLHSNEVDDIISAEIPDPVTDPRLHDIVTTQMVHGPCGALNPLSPCMADGKCTNDIRDHPFAATLMYVEMPKYYTWNQSTKKFQRRKQGTPVPDWPQVFSTDALGRMYTVHPRNDECFICDCSKQVYETLMQAVDNNTGGLFFLDAPGGTGKTFVISLILATIRSRCDIALALASSGIAATLLDGGRTAFCA